MRGKLAEVVVAVLFLSKAIFVFVGGG